MKWLKNICKSLRGIDTPFGGASWEPVQIEDMEVNMNFPSDSGLQRELEHLGYDVYWCSLKKLAKKTEIQGWEKVIWENESGDQFYLKTYDGLTLIQRHK